jgi:hypothetical protein
MDPAKQDFNEALEELWPEIRRLDKDMGIWLAQSILVNADEDCRRKITANMRRWTELAKRREIT